MPTRPPYPREARVVPVKKGTAENPITRYELRADHPHENSLISEHESEQEAQDAKERYENEAKE